MKREQLSRGLKMMPDDRKFWQKNKRAANRTSGTEIPNRISNRTTTRNNFKLSTIAIPNENRTRNMAISSNRFRTKAVLNDNGTRTMAVSSGSRIRTVKHFRIMATRKDVTAQIRLLPCTAPNITPTIPIIDGRSKTVSQAVTFLILGGMALAFLYFLVRNAMKNIPCCRKLLRRLKTNAENSSADRSRKTSSAVRLMSRDGMV